MNETEWQARVKEALVLFSKQLAIVQGEYNAQEKLSVVQNHAEDAQAAALAAITKATAELVVGKDDTQHQINCNGLKADQRRAIGIKEGADE